MTRNHRWTKEEVAIVMRDDITITDKMKLLCVSEKSIAGVYWRVSKGVKSDRAMIGGRTLLAKTCSTCGLLLDASSFYKESSTNKGLHYTRTRSSCKWCVSRWNDHKDGEYSRGQQDLSLPTSGRSNFQYMQSDHDICSDASTTLLQKARAMERTYYATLTFVKRNKYTSKTRLGDKTESQWRIEFKEEQ